MHTSTIAVREASSPSGVLAVGPKRFVAPTEKISCAGNGTAYLFGKGTGSWKTSDTEARERIATFANRVGYIKRIWGIRPSDFNAQVIPAAMETFPEREERHGVELLLGARVDGVHGLGPGEGAWLASADCYTVVIGDGTDVVVVHAGRDSLITRHWLPTYAHLEGRPNVIENALAHFAPASIPTLSAHILCGMSARSTFYSFGHPQFGASNKRLADEVSTRWSARCAREATCPSCGDGFFLSLLCVISTQLQNAGLARTNIDHDHIDTFADGDGGRWWSAARKESGRNGVLILRH